MDCKPQRTNKSRRREVVALPPWAWLIAIATSESRGMNRVCLIRPGSCCCRCVCQSFSLLITMARDWTRPMCPASKRLGVPKSKMASFWVECPLCRFKTQPTGRAMTRSKMRTICRRALISTLPIGACAALPYKIPHAIALSQRAGESGGPVSAVDNIGVTSTRRVRIDCARGLGLFFGRRGCVDEHLGLLLHSTAPALLL